MMVKNDDIFMPFSNPTCHFRNTANFPVGSLQVGKLAGTSEMARNNDREQFQRKEGRSVDFQAILKQMPLEQA